jgi:predicted amidophosphoribosyltransferase
MVFPRIKMSFFKKFFGTGKPPRSPLPCDICGRDIAKYNVWTEIRLCSKCERVFCNSCMKNLKKGRCDQCGYKTVKTQRILNYPPTWNRVQAPPPVVNPPNSAPAVKQSYCRYCGGKLDEKAKICSNCGTLIDSE